MNEKLQYASMLEIPVNTCNITYAPVKKKKPKTKKVYASDDVKKQLLNKVNETEGARLENTAEISVESAASEIPATREEINLSRAVQSEKRRRPRFSFAAAELIIIGLLIATICLTNAFNENSGINAFMRSVFQSSDGTEQVLTDTRTYGEFSPVIAYKGEALPVVEDGVTTIAGEGSVYAICDGTVTKVSVDGAGKYSLEIAHSDNFKTVLSGLDYAYAEVNDKIYGNIPVGYCGEDGVKLCFLGADGAVITDYTLDGNAVVWKAA